MVPPGSVLHRIHANKTYSAPFDPLGYWRRQEVAGTRLAQVAGQRNLAEDHSAQLRRRVALAVVLQDTLAQVGRNKGRREVQTPHRFEGTSAGYGDRTAQWAGPEALPAEPSASLEGV